LTGLITESKRFLLDEEIHQIKQTILDENFAWYCSNATSNKFPFLSHVLIRRYDHIKGEPEFNSYITPHILNIFQRFVDEHNIKVDKVTRACLNLTHYHGKYENCEPHVDHDFPHKVFMLYLNDTSGDTLVFDKVYNGKKRVLDVTKKLKVLKRIKPELGKAVCWDGKYYHAASFCKPMQRRVVAVITFTQ